MLLPQAKNYAKKPRPGKASKPFFNKDPPTTTFRPHKRPRTDHEGDDQNQRPPSPTGDYKNT